MPLKCCFILWKCRIIFHVGTALRKEESTSSTIKYYLKLLLMLSFYTQWFYVITNGEMKIYLFRKNPSVVRLYIFE